MESILQSEQTNGIILFPYVICTRYINVVLILFIYLLAPENLFTFFVVKMLKKGLTFTNLKKSELLYFPKEVYKWKINNRDESCKNFKSE